MWPCLNPNLVSASLFPTLRIPTNTVSGTAVAKIVDSFWNFHVLQLCMLIENVLIYVQKKSDISWRHMPLTPHPRKRTKQMWAWENENTGEMEKDRCVQRSTLLQWSLGLDNGFWDYKFSLLPSPGSLFLKGTASALVPALYSSAFSSYPTVLSMTDVWTDGYAG